MTEIQSQASDDVKFMRLALEEAAKARGQTSPNPMVGCLVVRDGEIIARGHHRRAGEDHAEVVALREAGESAKGAELYVSLEPCSHFGRTPPCVHAVISSGIRRVVAAMIDPDPRVSGRGMSILEKAGIETVVGVCEDEARRLNEGFISRITRQRPFITVKLAMSLDGKIATRSGDSQWISGEKSRRLVHDLRARSNAITVGPGTAMFDNPRLTARFDERIAESTPGRYVVEGRHTLPPDAHVFRTADASTTLFSTHEMAGERARDLESRGVKLIHVNAPDDPLGVRSVVGQAYTDGAAALLVEGGAEYAGAFFDAELVDRLILFIAPRVIGGRDAVSAIGGLGALSVEHAARALRMRSYQVGDDLCIEADFTEL